jgi:glycerophosphoryl diester phosphodiesterase
MQYPENTVTAVSQSAEYVDAVEVDVRRCSSGELVVFHDETVDRLTDGSGQIAEQTWQDLSSLEILDSGEAVPKLSTVVDSLPESVALQVELKETGLASEAQEVLTGVGHDITVSSFLPAALDEVNELGWDVSTGFLFESNPEQNLKRALKMNCNAVHPHYELCLSSDIVDKAHDVDLRVVAWKAARSREEIQALKSVDVDGVTADRWDIV